MATAIDHILGPGGLLAGTLESYEPRSSQLEMAHLIEDALRSGRQAMVEGGTGTGKTFGYLVPLILSGKKCVISTGTKNLQEQIHFKDIPLLERAGLKSIDSIMMKGRRNYLCLYRYRRVFIERSPVSDSRRGIRGRLERWLGETSFADRAELRWMSDGDPVWEGLSASSDQCLGGECPYRDNCFLNRLRMRAAEARIVIVNHHLLCADLKVRQGGFGEIIPRSQVFLFDEAHSLDEVATSYFGERISTHQLIDLISDWEKVSIELGMSPGSITGGHLENIAAGTDNLSVMFEGVPEKGKIEGKFSKEPEKGPVMQIARGLSGLMEAGREAPQFALLRQRAGEYKKVLTHIFASDNQDRLAWYEKRARNIILYSSPLDVAGPLQELLYRKIESVIFTSATLTTGGTFDYVKSRLGARDPIEAAYPSHFDFMSQAILYIPGDLPPPGDPSFPGALAPRILEILLRTRGRALVLFTSYSNLNAVHGFLVGRLPYTVYRQGDAPRTALLEAFRKEVHSVLLATGSFWEGVDVPGQSLSCLVIDKLPFASPAEPLVSARIDAIRRRGGNPFMEYQVPSAIISLRQGLGRLIRNRADRGVLAILDVRILKSRYGSLFLASMPPMTVTNDIAGMAEFLQSAGDSGI